MSTDVAVVKPAGEAAAPRTLTRSASLNAAASLIEYATKLAVGLVLTPILVSGLGRTLFGVWEMVNRLIGYVSATDGRPTQALRLVVASQQAAADPVPKRRYVGAALAVWVGVLPLVTLVGGAIAWYAPVFTNAPAAAHATVRLTAALLIATFLLGSLAAIPESVLRGMNLGYKRVGVQAGLSVVGGALSAAAIESGLGLVGLAASQIARAVLTGICFWVLVRTYVKWFGVALPTRADLRAIVDISVWLAAGDLIAQILLASDVLILGAVVSPAAVATYALTGYAARTAVGIHVFTATAAMPGIGGLIGRHELGRAARARAELLTLTWLFVTTVGTAILLWNRSFIALWVGLEHYAGFAVDALILLVATQTAFIRTDGYVIDAALQPRARVAVAAAAAALTIVLSIPLTMRFGTIGLCVGVLLARATQSIAYPLLTRKHLGQAADGGLTLWGRARLALVSAILFGAAATLGQRTLAATWPVWVGGLLATLAIAAAAALWLGLGAADRRLILHRVDALRRSGISR